MVKSEDFYFFEEKDYYFIEKNIYLLSTNMNNNLYYIKYSIFNLK